MDQNQASTPFDYWCVVGLMGHQRIAGRVTEESRFGTALLRVDVPDTSKGKGYTKYYGASAIYDITPVDEAVARAVAEHIDLRPVETWELRKVPALSDDFLRGDEIDL